MQQLFKFDEADATDTEFCKIKNDSRRSLIINDKTLAIQLIASETIFSSWIPDKDFNEFLNLLRFLVTKTTVEENEKAFVS